MHPSFDLVGFWVPFVAACIYSPAAFRSLYPIQWIILFFSGVISYTFANHQADFVGLMPVYVIGILEYLIRRSFGKVPRVPAMAFMAAAFFSLAIPDILRTHEWFPMSGTVGGGGIKDGLILFWLLPSVFAVVLWTAPEIENPANGVKASFAKFARKIIWNFRPCATSSQ